jgi:hypothetical protein
MPFAATVPGLKYVHNGHHFTNSEYKSVYVMTDGIHVNHSSIWSCPVYSLRWTKPLPAAQCRMGLSQCTACALDSEDSVYSVVLTHDAKHVEIGFVNIVSGLFRHRTKISRSFIKVIRKLKVQNNWTLNCPHSWSRNGTRICFMYLLLSAIISRSRVLAI